MSAFDGFENRRKHSLFDSLHASYSEFVIASLLLILGLQPRDMAAMLVVKTIKIISNNLHENGI